MFLSLILGLSIFALVCAALFASWVLKQDTGTPEMRKISDAIKEGAEAFMARQNKTIALLCLLCGALIFFLYAFVKGDMEMAQKTTVSFFLGALCSGIAGYIGMSVAIRSNIRTASAVRESLNKALQVALRGGAVAGLSVMGLSILGMTLLFWAYGGFSENEELVRKVPFLMVGFGFGASFVALFAQLGGGIYTKAADVGADLVGKVEAGIPEDDPRNPAVIADLVGDNVGDCAGRGADLFESISAENVGAMILGVALFPRFGIKGILFPLLMGAVNIVSSVIGILAVRTNEKENPMSALNRGYYITSILSVIAFYFGVQILLDGNIWLFAASVVGILTALAFLYLTQYYTESNYRPVKMIADSSVTGPATNIIAGISVGLECTAPAVLIISAALLGSYYCGVQALGDSGGIYGTALATMGILGPCVFILAMDVFGPITDNAGGIAEMSHQPANIREKTDKLDAVGNTTKALTKGYAIASASLAAFLLFSAYLDEVGMITGQPFTMVNLVNIKVFVGALIGAALIFFFSSITIRAVGTAAYTVIAEVRRQFRENPGIMAGTAKPDYAACVDIVTKGALKQMVLPGLVAVTTPIVVGYVLKAEAVAAFLMVGTISGILMALFLNNAGGAWDNAKKYIETGVHGGKRSDAHKAAVVGDTVGDPFKDTAGPSLHVLIKLLATITLVMASLFV